MGQRNEQRKAQILDFISAFSREKGIRPTIREIGAAVGLKSASSVHRYVDQLKAEGLLVSIPRVPRSLMPGLPDDQEVCRRYCLELSDGGSICLDATAHCDENNNIALVFSGILDASDIRAKVAQIVGCTTAFD